MEIKDKGLPIHEDAELKIRPRIFLEGNFFVDLQPARRRAELDDGERPIPTTQTAAPVQFGDLLAALQSDTRADLQIVPARSTRRALEGEGAAGFNESIKYWEAAYRSTAHRERRDARARSPTQDLQRLLKGQAGDGRARWSRTRRR